MALWLAGMLAYVGWLIEPNMIALIGFLTVGVIVYLGPLLMIVCAPWYLHRLILLGRLKPSPYPRNNEWLFEVARAAPFLCAAAAAVPWATMALSSILPEPHASLLPDTRSLHLVTPMFAFLGALLSFNLLTLRRMNRWLIFCILVLNVVFVHQGLLDFIHISFFNGNQGGSLSALLIHQR